MSDAPYSWSRRAAQFGNTLNPTWNTATPNRAWELHAAMQQHDLAYRVNEWKRINRQSNRVLAQAVGLHPETVGRYLRGEATMPLDVFNHLAHLVGLDVTVILAAESDDSVPER